MWQWERERGFVCVFVWERVLGYIQVFLMCLAVLLLRCTRMLWLGMPCYTLKKEKKRKKEQAASCPVFLYKCWLILEGGRESVSCHSVFYSFYRNTPSQESQASSFSLSKSDLFANVPKRMSVFLYKCKGSATVRTYMITVTITCCQNDNRDIKNRVQQFSICSMPYTNEHLYYSLWWRCGLQLCCGGGWRRRNWQGSWKQFSNYALCQWCRDLEEEGTGGDGWKAVRMREWDTEKHTFL